MKKNRQVIHTMLNTITKPSASFREIAENENHYYGSAVVIFAVSCFLSLFLSVVGDVAVLMYENDDQQQQQRYGISIVSYVMQLAQTILQNFVMIMAIFWIGKKLGGSHDFKKIFSVLSYCLIPAIILAILLPVTMSFTSQPVFYEGLVGNGDSRVGGGTVDLDSDLSPSYALDFASSTMISNVFAISFGVWVMALYVKAVKTTNGFSMKKSIAIVILAAVVMYASTIALASAISSLFLYSGAYPF